MKELRNSGLLLKEKELSACLNVSLNHIARMRKANLIKWHQFGKSPRYLLSEVMETTLRGGVK
jgi:hypothetical protein